MESLSRSSGQSNNLLHLRKKISNLEVMMQKMNLENKSTPEPEEEEIEDFLKRIVIEYIQMEKSLHLKKGQVFRCTNEETAI